MNAVFIVARTELLDLFRDRRTVVLGLLLMPALFPALILGMGSLAESKARTQLESTLALPVIGAQHAPNLVRFIASQNVRPLPPPRDAEAEVRAQNVDAVLKIAPDYEARWRNSQPATVEIIYDSSRQDSRIPVARIRSVIERYSGQLGVLRIIERGISPILLHGELGKKERARLMQQLDATTADAGSPRAIS